MVPAEIITDGKLHRCPTVAKPHKQNGAYIAHLDSPATLWWCNWESSEQDTFTESTGKNLSPAEKDALQQRLAAMRQQRDAEFVQRQAAAAQKAQNELNATEPCSPEHPYLLRKGVPALTGMRQDRAGTLLIPSGMQRVKCKACNVLPQMEKNAFLPVAKSTAGILSSRVTRKSPSPCARACRKSAVNWKLSNIGTRPRTQYPLIGAARHGSVSFHAYS